MTRKDYTIPVLLLLGVWILDVFSICPHHCIKRLLPDSCPETTSVEMFSRDFGQSQEGQDASYEESSRSREWSQGQHSFYRPTGSREWGYSQGSSGNRNWGQGQDSLYPIPPGSENWSRPPNRQPSNKPDSFEWGNNNRVLLPPPGKLQEVITGLDINFNCRIFDQGKLHYRFKLDDQGEHKCLQCFCYAFEREGAEPGCTIVEKIKCYEMGLQSRPKIKEKLKKFRAPPGTRTGPFPFGQFAQLHGCIDGVGLGCLQRVHSVWY